MNFDINKFENQINVFYKKMKNMNRFPIFQL